MKKAFSLFVITVLLCSMASCSGISSDDGSTNPAETTNTPPAATTATPETTAPAKKSGKINMEKFEKINSGMTYEEVVAIIGEKGELSSEVDMGIGSDFVTQIYTWQGEGILLRGNANITFQGGKVVAKAQFGLD